jgi:hypothetical protein
VSVVPLLLGCVAAVFSVASVVMACKNTDQEARILAKLYDDPSNYRWEDRRYMVEGDFQ